MTKKGVNSKSENRFSQITESLLRDDFRRAKSLARRSASKAKVEPNLSGSKPLYYTTRHRGYVPYGSRGNMDEDYFLERMSYHEDLPADEKRDMIKAAKIWHRYQQNAKGLNGDEKKELSERIIKKYGLKGIHEIDYWNRGDKDDKRGFHYSRYMHNLYDAVQQKNQERRASLEKIATTTSIIGIVSGLFFLSPNITGNVVGNMTNSTSNILGLCLLFVGLIGGFFWFNKSKKKNSKPVKRKLRKKKK